MATMHQFFKDEKLIISLVGLPARGKTYYSRKLVRYLTWLGYKSALFNIGNYRRKIVGTNTCKADFFDPNNESAVKEREQCAKLAMKDLIDYLQNKGGNVAIYDGTNTTKKRRNYIRETVNEEIKKFNLIFLESICTDEEVVENNIRQAQLHNPDYVGVDPEEAIQDFQKRIEQYKGVYETLSEEEDVSFIQIIDNGTDFRIHQIQGYLQSQIVMYLMNLHTIPRPIYVSRHGESVYNVQGKVGGDSDLSNNGYRYAAKLGQFFLQEIDKEKQKEVLILTSTLQRALNTVKFIKFGIEPISMKALDEINVGNCDGFTYEEIKEKYPEEARDREINKLEYRYPRGESYLDMIARIEPVIFEIERSRIPVIIIGHQGILRCLYAYFVENEIIDIPYLDMPLHTIIQLVPDVYFCKETRYQFNLDSEVISRTMQRRYSSATCGLDVIQTQDDGGIQSDTIIQNIQHEIDPISPDPTVQHLNQKEQISPTIYIQAQQLTNLKEIQSEQDNLSNSEDSDSDVVQQKEQILMQKAPSENIEKV